MAKQEIRDRSDPESMRAFMRALLEDVRALERMLEGEWFETGVRRIGTSSFTVWQEAWQGGELAVTAETTLIHFDYRARQSLPLSDAHREGLRAWLTES